MTRLEAPPLPRKGHALFLDFDGTLVELAEAPDAISVAPVLGGLLARLGERLNGRIAIVSGRALGDLDAHLSLQGIAASGSHGNELRLSGGDATSAAPLDGLAWAIAQVQAFAEERRGLLVEAKPAGVALHYRQAPEREGEVLTQMTTLADATGLHVQRGKMVAELRPAGADKGSALRRLMTEPAFAGAIPLFVGDDITDEDGFAAAARMGGGGVLVGAPRESAARWGLADVSAVLNWLQAAAK
jgi:trehalose 6-phosphate phosphatase